jgi:hypothetical protein
MIFCFSSALEPRSSETADPSASLGMTKGDAVLSLSFSRTDPCSSLSSKWNDCPSLCHPACPGVPWEQLTCLGQVEGVMTRQKIAIDTRPGGPTAKRQPSPEGLGNRSRRGSERRRRGTKPIVRSRCVIRSEAGLSRRAVEGSAVSLNRASNAEEKQRLQHDTSSGDAD